MRTAVSRLELLEPASVAEALRMLQNEGPLIPLAGATDIYAALNAGTPMGQRFLNLWHLDALRRITCADDVVSIGALATYASLQRSVLVRRRLPILAQAAAQVGGLQIQNRGTIGGNVAAASPAGDTLPVLAVADARVVLRSAAAGDRRVPITEFSSGPRQTVRRPDELILAIEVPPVEGAQWFRKVGTRAAQAVSKVVMAGVRGPAPRVALGSVAPTVVRLRRTEAALGRGASLEEAIGLLGQEISPIDDIRSTARYRAQVAANLLRRFWSDTEPGAFRC